MDADCEFEQIYKYINRICVCRCIFKDSSTIDYTPVINGKEVDLKKLNVYDVDIFVEGCMISDEMDYESFSAIAYVFKYDNRIYYIDCKHVQCDKHEFGPQTHTKFIPILSTAFDVHLLNKHINNMYKYGYGCKEDQTSLYTTFTRDITKYTSDYHAYKHCFNRRGWKFFMQPVKESEACLYVDYRYEDGDGFSDSDSDSCSDSCSDSE